MVVVVAVKWLPRDLIQGPYLALVLSERAFHRAMGHMKVPMDQRGSWVRAPQADATTHVMEHPECGLACVVALRTREGTTGIQIAALLVHEAVHIFQEWCQYYGEQRPSSEFEAYSIQAIAQRLMTSYAEQTAGGAT